MRQILVIAALASFAALAAAQDVARREPEFDLVSLQASREVPRSEAALGQLPDLPPLPAESTRRRQLAAVAELVRESMKAAGYRIRSIHIGSAGGGPGPVPVARAMAAAPSPIALEAGVSQIAVTVSGSIQLR